MQALTRRWLLADGGLALILVGFLVLEYLALGDLYVESMSSADTPSRLWLLALSILATVPVAGRRLYPVTAAVVAHIFHVIVTGLGFQPTNTAQLALLVTFYSLALYVPPRRADIVRGVIMAAMVGWVTVGALVADVPFGFVAIVTLVYAAAWVMGNTARARLENADLLRERAERAERDQQREAMRAVRTERARIARELHDVIAHNITVMTLQAAGAKRVLAQAPEQAFSALEAIEASGRQALSEMRRAIGVMRSEDSVIGLEPQPDLAGLNDLFEQIAAGGVDITANVPNDIGPLPPGVELTVYRIIQEALTNTLKHAGPHPKASVTLSRTDRMLRVMIDDDGVGAPRGVDLAAQGHGIVGMRERVLLYGGTLEAGPRLGGGFRVSADIPLETPA